METNETEKNDAQTESVANDSNRQYKFLGVLAVLVIIALGAVYYSGSQAPLNSIVLPSDDAGMKKIATYEELDKYMKANADSYAAYGGMATGQMEMTVKSAADSSAAPPREMSPNEKGGSSGYSKTNTQVEGVDEADIVKSDGKYLYAVAGGKIAIIDAYPAEDAKNVSEIDFNGTVSEIFINGDRLVAFGQMRESLPVPVPVPLGGAQEKMIAPPMYPEYSPKTTVKFYDISDKSSPADTGEITIDGSYYDSRMIGKHVYVIASKPTYYTVGKRIPLPEITTGGRVVSQAFPEIYYFNDIPGNVFTTIASIDIDDPKAITSKVLLTNYAQNMYVSEKNVYLTYTKWMSEVDFLDQIIDAIMPEVPADVQKRIKAIMDVGMSKQLKMQAVGEILQEYDAALSDEEQRNLQEKLLPKMEQIQQQIAREREKTVIQKIAIDNGNIEYKANGEVRGNILNQFSMDEHNGYFRIATTTSGNGGFVAMSASAVAEPAVDSVQTAAIASEPPEGISMEEQQRIEEKETPQEIRPAPQPQPQPQPQPMPSGPVNNVYVLDGYLNIVGKLEDLAHGESIYSARFLGDKAYMVTFRQTDPLFVIDLSSPDSPKILGYLKIPGVSDYLHPYDEDHVIGVGRDATDEGRMKGMKLSLFDVSDVANPKELSKYIIGDQGTYSEALSDHKAFLFSREKNLLVIPISEWKEIVVKPAVTENGPMRSTGLVKTYRQQGAYVFSIDLNDGIKLKGKVTHQDAEIEETRNYYGYLSQIRRSLYIGNVLYTVSWKTVMMSSLDSLKEINRVDLPFEQEEPPREVGIDSGGVW